MSDIIAKINKKLDQLGKYEPTPKEVIEECYESIKNKLADGWNFDRLAKIISAEGCQISGQILKQQYNKIHNAKNKSVSKSKETSSNNSAVNTAEV